ncbi:MAG TPA: cyclic nucleotide-binding domain-containing protein, partial [Candidatus Limnocylindrales bacterium]|nr:cyclic nucleotide-binding domain-containing protein [Candidatus Limnocylindrales bacterium]
YGIGGPAAVATVAVLRTVPSVALAPLLTTAARGLAADTMLRLTLVVRVVAIAMTAILLLARAPSTAIYLPVAVDAVAATLLRPIRGSLLPAIARSPDELVAGNVALTTGDSLANLVGPSLATAALVLTGIPSAPVVPGIVLVAASLVTSLGIQGAQPLRARRERTVAPASADGRHRPGDEDVVLRPPRRGAGAAMRDAGAAIRPALPVIGAFTAQRFIRGALTVLLVAASIDLLGMGDAGVGLLTAAIGLGGLVGGGVALGLIGGRRLAPWFAAGIAVWCAAITMTGAIPVPVVALAVLALGGIGKVLIDVAGYSLLQRSVANEYRTQVLGFQEGLVTAALALGAVTASTAIDALGIRLTLVAAGLLPPLLVAAAWPRLRNLDAAARGHDPALRLLDRVPLFAPLQLAVKEELAAGLRHQTAAPGEAIVRQGETGHRFFIVEAGEVAVEIDGRTTGRLGSGDAFGEIALLRDVPRTATVRAVAAVGLATLDRESFIAAVTGHADSALAAEQLIVDRLGG